MPLILSGTTGVSGVDGTAGTPAVQGTDSNTGIVFGTDAISLVEGGTTALSVNSDGQTVLGAGTASLPAMSTTGDLNTGTFYPAADTIGWTTGGSERARIDSSGNLLVGYTSSNGSFRLQVNSQIFATSATIATSDARYKENVEPITDGLALVNALNPVSFNWKEHPVHAFDTETKTVGFLAQEVQAALADKPYVNSIIKESECELPDGTKEKFLGIAEGNMVSILTKAIQELSAKLEAAEARIAALEAN